MHDCMNASLFSLQKKVSSMYWAMGMILRSQRSFDWHMQQTKRFMCCDIQCIGYIYIYIYIYE